MKILIIGFSKIKYMPYLNLYINNIDSKINDIHVVKWDRDQTLDVKLPDDITLHTFKYSLMDTEPKWKKVLPFRLFRNFVKQCLTEELYDRVIVLHSLPAVLIYDILVKKFQKRFIVDYRDSTFESNPVFRKLVHKLVNNSYATFVSSDAFRRYLPEHGENILTIHNLDMDSLRFRNCANLAPTLPIKVSFWGLIRHRAINELIISRIAKDNRFELHYYGRMQGDVAKIVDFSRSIGANNVFFHGEYLPKQKHEFALTSKLIHNIYDNEDTNMSLAMPNKFYDGVVYGIPQLCNGGSHVANQVAIADVGFSCNPAADSFCDEIFDYYMTFDRKKFFHNCEETLDTVIAQNGVVNHTIKAFVGN